MTDVLVLGRQQTQACLEPGRVLAGVAAALIAISRDEVSAPARIAARTPAGLLGAMPAYVPGQGLAAKLVSIFAHKGQEGRSAHQGVVALFDDQDGRLLALMDGEPITAVRTAAAATLSMQALARRTGGRIAIVGTGVQASAQADLLAEADVTGPVVVGGRDQGRAQEVADRFPGATAAGIEAAVRDADVVFCCTGAVQPVIRADWLVPGAHVSSVGGSAGPEIDPAIIGTGSVFAEWAGAAAAPPPAGAHELQGVPPERITLLGAVLDGRHPGRREQTELTVFKSTGHGALDVAAAAAVYEVARERGAGLAADF